MLTRHFQAMPSTVFDSYKDSELLRKFKGHSCLRRPGSFETFTPPPTEVGPLIQ